MMKRVFLAGFAFVALAPGANSAAEQVAEVAVNSESKTESTAKTPSYSVRSRMWTLNSTGGASATIAPEEGKNDTYRVTIADAPAPVWTIQLNSDPFGVREKQAYQLSFRARADKPRSMVCMISMNRAPWTSAGLYREVKLTTDWQDFTFPFLGAITDKNVRLSFNFGGEATSLEIADVQFNGDWKVFNREGSESKITRSISHPEQVGVDITKVGGGKAGQIQLVREGVGVTEKQPYTLGFRAKSTKPRSMFVSIGRNAPPWTGYGMYQEVSLSEQWQAFQLPFRSTNTDENARIVFELGGSDGSVEIADVSLFDGQWTLVSSEGASAALLQPMDLPGLIAIVISKAGEGSSARSVQLFKSSGPIVKNKTYAVSFMARATAPRPLSISVGRAMAPWESLGFSTALRLVPDWINFRFSFEATAESSSSRIVFDLGASTESVELREVMVTESEPGAESTAPNAQE